MKPRVGEQMYVFTMKVRFSHIGNKRKVVSGLLFMHQSLTEKMLAIEGKY